MKDEGKIGLSDSLSVDGGGGERNEGRSVMEACAH